MSLPRVLRFLGTLVLVVALAACSRASEPIVGSAETFSGGGNYANEIERARGNVKKVFVAMQSGAYTNEMCSDVEGISPTQAVLVAKLLLASAPKVVPILDRLRMEVVPQTLTVRDGSGALQAVKAKFHRANGKAGDFSWVKFNQAAWTEGLDAQMVLETHELIHAGFSAAENPPDFSPVPGFDSTAGGQRKLDRAGDCVAKRFRTDFSPGLLVRRYATAGIVGLPTTGAQFFPFALQDAGRVLLSASPLRPVEAVPGSMPPIVQRLTAAGALDPEFGDNGSLRIVPVTPIADIAVTALHGNAYGKIIVTGYSDARREGGALTPWIARYDGDGKLDSAFSATALQEIAGFSAGTLAVFMETIPDDRGRLLVAMQTCNPDRQPIFVVRFLSDGRLDRTFGTNGLAQLPVQGLSDGVRHLALTPEGKIAVAAVSYAAVGGNGRLELARLTGDGRMDSTFHGDGMLLTGFTGPEKQISNEISLVVAADGSLVVAGTYHDGAARVAAVLKVLPDGSPDYAFGPGGVLTPFAGADSSALQSVALQRDGKLLVAGWLADNGILKAALARLMPSGGVDLSFTNGGEQKGIVRFGIDPSGSMATSILRDETGSLFIGGYSAPPAGPFRRFVARFMGGDDAR